MYKNIFTWILAGIFLILTGCKNEETTPVEAKVISLKTDYPATPDSLYGNLFTDVQMQQIFPDGKTFVDCIPKEAPAQIRAQYEAIRNQQPDLKKFVADHFYLPEAPEVKSLQNDKDITKHIKDLWPVLTRKPDSVIAGSSLLALPFPYIVPGGRFREIYYWDSYFTMLGLKASGETEMIENMVKNFAYLIRTYNHIPNGNRSYYLSRSQPPFFSLMVAMLAELKGEEQVYRDYLDVVEREYVYWMQDDKETPAGTMQKRFAKMPDGEYLNRYWDEKSTPRQESYREDVEVANKAVEQKMSMMRFASQQAMDSFKSKSLETTYSHLRAGAASGWDFSSRWFVQPDNIGTIETTDIVPVDLNCLLYFTETLLAKMYTLQGEKEVAADFTKWAKDRENAINKYFYNDSLDFYNDYHFIRKEKMNTITAAGLFPFCFFDSSAYKEKAQKAAAVVQKSLLAEGGLLTTTLTTGQQWDAPNGWAPLQWMAVWGMDRCGQPALAKDLANRWITLNKAVYTRTGKLMEKYNVVNTQLDAGGGEYPGQDGFGWTNGVLLALMEKYKDH
jgi:alpha,alpha-trehalase